jgi:hypothetical protein
VSSTPPATLRRDQVLVSLAAVLWVGGTLVGTGVTGAQGVEDQGGGLFSDSATLIAPHGPAFSIWSVIYAGLVAYLVWQWLPAGARSRWAAVTRGPAALGIALNGTWLLVVFAGWIWVSVLVMLGIVAALGTILARTAGLTREGWPPRVAVSATFGLYLGWICVALCANVATLLVDLGVPASGAGPALVTVAVLAVVLGLVAWLLRRTDDTVLRATLVAAVVWGVSWVAVGRFVGDLRSDTVGYAAAVTAVLVAVVGVLTLLQRVAGAARAGQARA